LRDEVNTGGIESDPAGFNGTRHSVQSPGSNIFEHMLIINLIRFTAAVKHQRQVIESEIPAR
jgi:hypothetical protein